MPTTITGEVLLTNGLRVPATFTMPTSAEDELVHGGTWNVRWRQGRGELTKEQADALLAERRAARRLAAKRVSASRRGRSG